MNSQTFLAVLAVSACIALTLGTPISKGPCDPKKCKLPNCRCWNDKSIPGTGIPPQFLILTFDYAFNQDNVDSYLKLFEGLVNPNGCKAKGTFFVQSLNSDAKGLQELAKGHHELAINSARGVIPTTKTAWNDSVKNVLVTLEKAGIPKDKIKGVRPPELFSGGNTQFDVMESFKLQYDSSCVNVEHSAPGRQLWPYTLDNIYDLPTCSIGRNVNKTFPGIWTFPVPVLDFDDLQCPTPTGCITKANTTDAVFNLFCTAFDSHYSNNRAPLTIDIDTQWVTMDFTVVGTKEFLQLVRVFQDTWIVTIEDALKWIQDPTGTDMGTFGCHDDELKSRRPSSVFQ